MRIQMLVRDADYRNALVDMISSEDRDIYIEVDGDSARDGRSVILTDIMPGEIDRDVLRRIARRTLFLSGTDPGNSGLKDAALIQEENLHVLFKYSCLSNILAELALVYHEWTGDAGSLAPVTKTIAVTGDNDLYSSERCHTLARQIIYRYGGSVLILPLGYINDYKTDAGLGRGWFTRLMYLIEEGRDYPKDSFVITDSYGINYLMLPPGLNPVAGLSKEYLTDLIRSVGCRFDTLILDIGSCYRRENLDVAAQADSVLFIGSGRRIPDIEKILGSGASGRLTKIRLSPDTDETLSIDEYAGKLYGQSDDEKSDRS